jgi:hypothetical protein
MATLISALIPTVRDRLIETQPNFWGDDELVKIMSTGIRDLWRDTVDLKQEHYLTIDNTNVVLPQQSFALVGVPADVHKVYMIEPRDLTANGANPGLVFQPLGYNEERFQLARSRDAVDPTNNVIYYDIFGKGAPVNAPTIVTAPAVTSKVQISFCYVPTLGVLTPDSVIPIPGEADNALIAWTVAFALAKEAEDKMPNQGWLAIYATEKQHLLQSLGLRQYQEPLYTNAVWQEYWP